MPADPTFRVTLHIQQLTNSPFNHSRLFVKWKTGKKSAGVTRIAEVRDHSCIWEDDQQFDVKLKLDAKTNTLQPHAIRFSVREASPTKGVEDFKRLGIAEFDVSCVARMRESYHRVLLQKTKATETLHFCIEMQQRSGAPTFRCPPLPQGMGAGAPADDAATGLSAATPVVGTPLKPPAGMGTDPMAELLRQANAAALTGAPAGGADRESLGTTTPSSTAKQQQQEHERQQTPLSAVVSSQPKSHRRGESSEVVVDAVFAAIFGKGSGSNEHEHEPEMEPEPEPEAPF